MALALLLLATAAGASSTAPVGLIAAGYDDDCQVRRAASAAEERCRYALPLFEGDEIRAARVESLGIDWLAPPHTKTVPVGASTVRVVVERAQGGVLSAVQGALSFLRKTPQRQVVLATRGGGAERCTATIEIGPGHARATVLPSQSVRFASRDVGATFTFTFSSPGASPRVESPAGNATAALAPDALGLAAGRTALVRSGDGEVEVELADVSVAAVVRRDLEHLEREGGGDANATRVLQAVYLLLVTEIADGPDFRWWAACLVSGVPGTDATMVRGLLSASADGSVP